MKRFQKRLNELVDMLDIRDKLNVQVEDYPRRKNENGDNCIIAS